MLQEYLPHFKKVDHPFHKALDKRQEQKDFIPIASNNFTMRRSLLFIDEELNNLYNKIALDL
jgi:hypothetical protein